EVYADHRLERRNFLRRKPVAYRLGRGVIPQLRHLHRGKQERIGRHGRERRVGRLRGFDGLESRLSRRLGNRGDRQPDREEYSSGETRLWHDLAPVARRDRHRRAQRSYPAAQRRRSVLVFVAELARLQTELWRVQLRSIRIALPVRSPGQFEYLAARDRDEATRGFFAEHDRAE